MDTSDHHPQHKLHFIEEVSLIFEQIGIPRMAGRVLGCLLISNPDQLSADQIASYLKASKGSLSIMTRLLIQSGLIERTAIPGERRDYFRIKPGIWARLLREKLQQITYLHQIAERGLGLIQDQPEELQQRLREMQDLYSYVEDEFPKLIDRWEQERQA